MAGQKILSSPPRPDLLWSPRGRSVKLTTHFNIVPRLRMREDIPPVPIHLHGKVLKIVQGYICITWRLMTDRHLLYLQI